MKCLHCKQETSNQKFCSCHCSATYFNLLKPKRIKKIRTCIACKNIITEYQGCRRCKKCIDDYHRQHSLEYISKLTIKDVKTHYTTGSQGLTTHATIRAYCARMLAPLKIKHNCCQICGYDKHVEFCHIKPIHQFDENATMQEINNENNIIVLCPNHHWELDNGMLPEIPSDRGILSPF